MMPSDSMSNLSKIRFHSSTGIDEDAFEVKVYVREMARVSILLPNESPLIVFCRWNLVRRWPPTAAAPGARINERST